MNRERSRGSEIFKFSNNPKGTHSKDRSPLTLREGAHEQDAQGERSLVGVGGGSRVGGIVACMAYHRGYGRMYVVIRIQHRHGGMGKKNICGSSVQVLEGALVVQYHLRGPPPSLPDSTKCATVVGSSSITCSAGAGRGGGSSC